MASPNEDGFIVCTNCDRELPGTKEYFFEHRDEFYPHCKECKGSEFGIQKPNYALDAKENHKFCARCLEELPATNEYFYTDNSSSDNLTVACKTCWNGTEYGIHKPNANRSDGKWKCSSCDDVYERTTENFYTQGDRLSPHCKECHCQKRTQRNRAKGSDTLNQFSGKSWSAVKDEYNHECAYCGESDCTLHRDHIVPVSKGGDTTVANIVPACESCNLSKADKRVSKWYPNQEFYTQERMDRILNTPICLYNG